METMNYDKIKNKSNAPLIAFITFIFLGSGAVAYTLTNEVKPVVIGQNSLVAVESSNVIEVKKDIEYSIKNVSRNSDNTAYKSNIVLPEITVEGVELTDINEQIKLRFLNKYDALEQSASGNLENAFTYKVAYTTNEIDLKDKKLLSIVFSEDIIAGKNDVFSSKKYGYVIDLEGKKILSSEEVAPLVLDYSYRKVIKEGLKDYIVSQGIAKEEEYNYSYTGLEEFYVKDEEFHIIFNPTEPFDAKFGIIDIEFKK